MLTPHLLDRMVKVRILVETRDDYLPQPHVTDLGDVPGPAAGRRVPCEECNRSGRLGKRYCPSCDGFGWRKRSGHEPEWCEYTETTVEEATQPLGAAGLVSTNREIDRLSASIDRIQAVLDAHEGVIDGERFAWERARTMYYRQGSYAQLDRGLARLRRAAPQIADAVLTRRPLELEAVGVLFLAQTMSTVRVPGFLMFERSVRQAPTVMSLHAEGMTPGMIAKRLRIPKGKVRRMLNGAAKQV